MYLRKGRAIKTTIFMWYMRLGHTNTKRMYRFIQEGTLDKVKREPLQVCKSCRQDKMTKMSFLSKAECATHVLESVHIDVCVPLNLTMSCGFEYFITFTDDYS